MSLALAGEFFTVEPLGNPASIYVVGVISWYHF